MKRAETIHTIFRRAGSLLLLVLLFSGTVIQASHFHHQVDVTEQCPGDDVMNNVDDCFVCDHYTQQAGKELFYAHPPVLDVPLPEPVQQNGRTYARIYKFTLQGFSNKGPPALS
ncbi:hypothetical protein [uncultured Chitinophaga sp.]|uniref:hypothetical protein n=1 Tax=uncultured Chitinophaga sp. TaxID=339340 RepID=UPI0025FD6E5B|nr:hypothetical protein [uncultured Chitinophaga sp.]